MVIGNGLMAQAFAAYAESTDLCILAAGVSDSTSTDAQAFQREQKLLEETIAQHPSMLFVYFSTCSIEDASVNHRAYCTHKLAMEVLIANRADRYLICRLSHIVGPGGNKHTIFNYLIDKLKSQESYDLWENAERNFLDVQDVAFAVHDLLRGGIQNRVVNIAHPESQTMRSIVSELEALLEVNSQHRLIDKGAPLQIDCPEMRTTFSQLDRLNRPEYITDLLAKYHHVSA